MPPHTAVQIVGGASSRVSEAVVLGEGKQQAHFPLIAGLLVGLPVGAVLVAAAVFKHYQRKAPVAPFKELDEATAGGQQREPKLKASELQRPSAHDPKANKVVALRQSFESMQAH